MFACYISPEEIEGYYPGFSGTLISTKTISPVLQRACKLVARDLTNTGIKTKSIYIPKMFDDLDNFEKISKSGIYTSASIKPIGHEVRFVAFFQSGIEHNLSAFTIQGSEDDTNWSDIATIEKATDQLMTIDWAERFDYVRYSISSEGSVSYSPFLVDTAYDEMIVHKAVVLIMSPQLKGDSRFDAIYLAATGRYAELLNGVKPDVDADGDGAIDAGDVSRGKSFEIYR